MHCVESITEIREAVSLTKAGAGAYCSNIFPAPRKLQDWICHGELFSTLRNATALLLRKDRDFWHLYFCAANPASLRQTVSSLPMLRTEPVVLDLVGREADLAGLVGLFEDCGFRVYNRLLRMARIGPPAVPPATVVPDPRVTIATLADCQPILDLLLRSFDCRAEQIPMPHEVETAVEAGQIWLVHDEGALAGLLFFETQGLTSTLRYWLVAPEFRTQGLGSVLMCRYFAQHPAVRRFLLWVIADNANAIAKYEHYGFAPDGLIDKVLANEMIQP